MKPSGRFFDNLMFRSIVVFLVSTLLVCINVVLLKSPIVGFIASVIYIYISSALCGNFFFRTDGFWSRILSGFSVFLTFIAVGGTVALIFYKLSTMVLVLLLSSISLLLIILNVIRYGLKPAFVEDQSKDNEEHDERKRSFFAVERVPQIIYITLASISFFLLLISRSEETRAIWDAINPAFLPLYFITTFVLILIIFSSASSRVKLFFVVIQSLLIHSLLVVVLSTGFGGDLWRELAFTMDLSNTGKNMPNLFEFLRGGYSPFVTIYYLLRKRTYGVLIATFGKMFGAGLYWVQNLLTPVLWGVLVPFFLYKIQGIISKKKNYLALSAFLSLSGSMLIWWGTPSNADTLSIVFFCFLAYLAVRHLSLDAKRTSYFLLFLVVFACFISHFKTGLLGFSVVLLAFAFEQYRRRMHKSVLNNTMMLMAIAICIFLLPVGLYGLYGVYPQTGYMQVSYDINKLIESGVWRLIFGEYVNFSNRDLLLRGLLVVLGIAGALYTSVYAPKKRYKRYLCAFLSIAVLTLMVQYRILKYAMVNIPFGEERLWVFRDLLLIPFAATMIGVLIEKFHEMATKSFSIRTSILNKRSFRLSMIILVFSLLFSGYVVEATREAFSKKPIMNPTQYEIEAVLYIDRNTEGRYAVVCDAIFQYLSQGILGFESRGTFLYRKYFNPMITQPSTEIMSNAAKEAGASVAFLVVSNRLGRPPLSEVVASTKEVLDIYAILGDGKLYIFTYPGVEQEMAIPIEIDSENQTREGHLLEYEVNWTREFSILPQARLDPNSIRVIAPDGSEVSSQHDYFQGWFDDCSTSDKWSAGSSDGDVLTFTAHFNKTTAEVKRLIYSEFEMEGGALKVDAMKYKYIEIKWRANYEKVASIRVVLWKRDINGWEPATAWATLSTQWDVWHRDISFHVNGTLGGLYLDVFKAKPYTWVGDYKVDIDWIRLVGDTGVVRFFYNGAANSVNQYRIEYDSLENTQSDKEDGLPKPSYPNKISLTEQTNYYNLTSNWSDQIVNFVINKTATGWIGDIPGTSFSYTLRIDGINILTSHSNRAGGLGVMLSDDSTSSINLTYTNAHLISEGPIMAEVCFEANGYGNLYVQFYQGRWLQIGFHTKDEVAIVRPDNEKYSWLISTSSLDNKVYYLNQNGEVVGKDMHANGSLGSWQTQCIGQFEGHGYLVALSTENGTTRTYGAAYNNFGLDALDFMYLNGSLSGDDLTYVISKDQSREEISNITLAIKNPPSISTVVPITLAVRTIDLFNQPVSDATIDVLELGKKVHTDTNGWAQVPISRGQWTLVASKRGVADEKKVDLLTNSATMQRLCIVEIDGFTLNIWEFTLVVGSVITGCACLLLLLRKKVFCKDD